MEKVGPRQVHDRLTPGQREALRYCWAAHARPMVQTGERTWTGQLLSQLVEANGARALVEWSTALVSMGRGAGKSRLAVEFVRGVAEENPGARICLMGQSAATVRKTLAFGRGGIACVTPPWNRPTWSVHDQAFTWRNGAVAYLFSADAPEAPRGFEFDVAVLDEAAFFRHLRVILANVRFALRAGRHPRLLVTTTPASSGTLRELRDSPGTIIVRGSLYDNARNLPASFVANVEAQYKGTSLERSELWGDPGACDEAEGALWKRTWLNRFRVQVVPKLRRVIVGVDPSASERGQHDTAGIVVLGEGEDGHAYVLEDATGAEALSPRQWALAAVEAFRRWHARHVVVETNRGGALGTELLRAIDPTVPIRTVSASTSKQERAHAVAAQTEAGRLHLVGVHAELEDELCSWDPTVPGAKSPGRLDALVWAAREILVRPPVPGHESISGRGPGRREL